LCDSRAVRCPHSTYRRQTGFDVSRRSVAKADAPNPVVITLNGERYELDHPMSVVELLSRLEIDPRRVAVEHNLAIIKRHTFSDVMLGEGDTVEIVNFVGGG
jgi:thiamine biosynthesis protein ThiS